eukprot:Rmarinus@m.10051
MTAITTQPSHAQLVELSMKADTELEKALEDILKDNENLLRENECYSRFLQKVSPHMSMDTDDDSDTLRSSKGMRSRGQTRGKTAQQSIHVPTTLTMDQKMEVLNQQSEDLREEIDAVKVDSEKLIDNLKTVMEETDIKIAEVRKDLYEFKRDVVVGAENFRTGRPVAEKVVRYLEDKLRAKDATIDKLRLKNATLKSQIEKMRQQLQQKEEMGEVLHVIDFDQLQIENQQYLEKIDERNSELLRLKVTTGRTVQVLNTLKKKLNNVTTESAQLRRVTVEKEDTLKKVASEIIRVEEEIKASQKLNHQLKNKQRETKMPQILDYVKQKALEYELDKEYKDWKRKLEIVEMGVKRAKMILRQTNGGMHMQPM